MGERRKKVTSGPASGVHRAHAGPRAGRIEAVTAEGEVLVCVGDGPARRALFGAHLSRAQLAAAARERAPVLVDFLDGDAARPVVVTLLVERVAAEEAPRRLLLRAEESVVIACGRAAIEIDAAGSVSVRGGEVGVEAAGALRMRGKRIDLN